MRNFSLALTAVLVCSAAGSAWATSVKVVTTTRRVTFTVDNSSQLPLVCSGKLTAVTKSGKYVDAKMEKESVDSGAFKELFITTYDDKDPFVDGWSDISCTVPNP